MSENLASASLGSVRRVDTAVLIVSEVSSLDHERCEREGVKKSSPTRNGVRLDSIRVSPQAPGVRYFSVNLATGHLAIELSSRILGARFGEGITESTLGPVAEALSALGYFTVTEASLSAALAQRIDIFVDLDVGKQKLPKLLFALRALAGGKHFRLAHDYPTSIAFVRRSRSTGVVLRAYDKGMQLLKGARQFRELIGPDIPAGYAGVLRLERQAMGRDSIRAMLRLPSGLTPVLGDVFRSEARPVSAILRALIDATPAPVEYPTLDEMVGEGSTLTQIERKMGKLSVIRTLDGDEGRIERLARLAAKRNASLYLPEYRALATAHRMGSDGAGVRTTSALIEELYQMVREAEVSPCLPVAQGSTPQFQ